MTIKDIETRCAEIRESVTSEDADIKALKEEAKELIERKKEILAEERAKEVEAEKRMADISAVASGEGTEIEKREEKIMTNAEVRNSKEYIDAYAKYIKTGKDAECRALLTENVEGGTVPVPELVENKIRTAWENDEIFRRITKTYVKGNLKVGFEISGTEADFHTEGEAPLAEETLQLGIVNLVPETIKKWISFSTEVMAMGSEDFLAYIYDELTYKIVRCAGMAALMSIVGAPESSSSSQVGVPVVDSAVTSSAIIDAIATLSPQATDRVFIAPGTAIANVRKAALNAGYGYDPFFGLTVIQIEPMTGMPDDFAIVGDLKGVQANLPEGEDVKFVFDEYSLAERDLVKVVGRLYAGIAVVQPGMFAVITESGD